MQQPLDQAAAIVSTVFWCVCYIEPFSRITKSCSASSLTARKFHIYRMSHTTVDTSTSKGKAFERCVLGWAPPRIRRARAVDGLDIGRRLLYALSCAAHA